MIGDPQTAASTQLEPLEKTQIEGTTEDKTNKVLDELSGQATQTAGVAGETLSQASGAVHDLEILWSPNSQADQ